MTKPNYGTFIGKVVTEWISDPLAGRNMCLLEPFAYIDPEGWRWTADAGSIINGASIPRFFWRIMGAPYTGRYRLASVVHDVACDQRQGPPSAVHRMFYYACRCAEVGAVKAWIMWLAVRLFGPRW